jgi:hypothetical protein
MNDLEILDALKPENGEGIAADQPDSTPEPEEGQIPESEEILNVSLGDQAEPEEEEHAKEAPPWVQKLRKSHRELTKANRELQAELKKRQEVEKKPISLGSKPTLEGLDYDSEKYEEALENWYEQKRAFEAEEAKKQAVQAESENAWKAKLQDYAKQRERLKVQDYEDAEIVAQEVFSVTQQGIILQGSEQSAMLIYALGKNQEKARELAKISDPVKFAFALAKLEKDLKVTKRQPSAAPEKTIASPGKGVSTADATLDRLRKEAEKTGNYSKVVAYKNQLKSKRG